MTPLRKPTVRQRRHASLATAAWKTFCTPLWRRHCGAGVLLLSLSSVALAGGTRASPSVAAGKAPLATMPTQTSRPTADIAERLSQADCKSLRLDAAGLAALQQILHPLGLGIQILGCPEAPEPVSQRVLALTAVVLDGDKAIHTVRGALGDGEPVDMGSDYRGAPWPSRRNPADIDTLDDSEVSPDVRFNRRWLRSVMASQGYASVTGPWWAFIPAHAPRKR